MEKRRPNVSSVRNRLSNVSSVSEDDGLADVSPRDGGWSHHGGRRHFPFCVRLKVLPEAALSSHCGVLVLHAEEQGWLREEGISRV